MVPRDLYVLAFEKEASGWEYQGDVLTPFDPPELQQWGGI